MHVVVIHGWKEDTAELAQAVAGALGLTVFDVRQRLFGGGPAVMGGFADPDQAGALAAKLNRIPVATLVIDTAGLRGGGGRFPVRRFELGESALAVETETGAAREIPYGEIELLLPATRIAEETETVKTTERKFSLGKTLLSGGIPLTKKVERQEEVVTESRERVLYLYAGKGQVVFSQGSMTYDGLGAAMQMSRELNFTFLMTELRRRGTGARYDDRLLNRVGQVRLLGPGQNPETNLDLAAEILARSLRQGR